MSGTTPPPPNGRAAAQAMRAERRTRALGLSAAGHTYDEIAKIMGYSSRQAAFRDVKAALDQRLKEQGEAVDRHRARQDALLNEALKVANEIMNGTHYAHSNGRVVRREVERPDGTSEYVDVLDDGPRLAAADRLIRISESRRKLHGWDAPAKTEISGQTTVSYQIGLTPDEMDQL